MPLFLAQLCCCSSCNGFCAAHGCFVGCCCAKCSFTCARQPMCRCCVRPSLVAHANQMVRNRLVAELLTTSKGSCFAGAHCRPRRGQCQPAFENRSRRLLLAHGLLGSVLDPILCIGASRLSTGLRHCDSLSARPSGLRASCGELPRGSGYNTVSG
jgi:hypothetical protein